MGQHRACSTQHPVPGSVSRKIPAQGPHAARQPASGDTGQRLSRSREKAPINPISGAWPERETAGQAPVPMHEAH